MTKTSVAAPRTSALDSTVTSTLAAEAYERFTALVRDLGPDDWTKPTDCPGWDVHAMAGHLLGMMEMVTSPEENARQGKAAAEALTQRGGQFIDALTAVQVAEHRHLGPAEIVDGLTQTAPKAVLGRQYTPEPIKQSTVPNKQLVGHELEEWTVGYMLDTILTRDPWMHRIDISRATGRDLQLTADHDGVIVADLVTEWAERHGSACQLTLTGPAGGTWQFGEGGPTLELDAVEFGRIVSGRGQGSGLLATAVPF